MQGQHLNRGYAVPVTGVRGTRVDVPLGDAVLVGEKPAIIVTLRMNSRGIREFVRYCERNNVLVRACERDAVPALPSVESIKADVLRTSRAEFEVIGHLEHLEHLTGHTSVVCWHHIHATKTSLWFGAQGQGEPKQKASKPRAKDERDRNTHAVVTGCEPCVLEPTGVKVNWEVRQGKL